MSKPNIRKITADPTKCNTDSLRRPSVFERLGTKPAIAAAATAAAAQSASDYCRNWALNGSCSYGKSCKYANTHTLISPSKRAKKDNAIAGTSGLIEDPFKRLTSKIVKKASHSPDLNIEEWNQTDLEYEDEKVLERRRQLLQRELELQMKKDKEVHGKDKVRQKKKAMSSSSSSRTSSTSSSSSSSSSEDSSSTSTSDSHKKVKKIKTKRHHSISADYSEDKERKRKLKLKRLGTRNDKAVSKKKRKLENSSAKKDLTVNRSVKKYGPSSVSRKHSTSLRARSPAIQQGSTSGVTSTTAATLGSQVSVAHHISSSSKIRERNRSESPKAMKGNREMDKEDGRHYKKVRDMDECLSKDATKCKSFDKIKEQQDKEKNRAIDEKTKADDRLRAKCKDKDVRSRTPPPPPSSERSSKYQHVKESISSKTRRSRTPDKTPSRTRRDLTPVKNPEKQGGSSNRARDIEKKDRDSHKRDKSKERDDGRKNEPTSSGKAKQTVTSSQDESYRRNNVNKDNFDEKTYGDKARQKSREHQREKETRDERHSRLVRDQRQEPQREKDKDESQERCRNERQRERDRDRDRDRERERERDRERDRERERERERDREREREREIRERDRERDREREKSIKSRERDVPAVIPSATLSLSTDKSSRYGNRIKERPLGKDVSFEKTAGTRERSRSERERERSETKALAERERSSTQSRLDGRYERSGVIEKDVSSSRSKSTSVNSPRDRMDRFREASLDRASLHDKSGHAATSSSIQSTATLPVPPVSSSSTVPPPSSRDHLMDIVDGHYDRDRHRRFGVRYERGHASEHTSRKDQARIESSRVPSKIDRIVDRRDANSPRHAIEVDRNFGRNYGRMPEHWDEQDEATPHVEYREHAHIHEDDRRKAIEGRRYDSPFEERRVARDERSRESRYVIQTTERASFDDHRHHHHHHRHPLYPGDKLRNSGANIRDETVSNDNWEGHHRDVEHGPRDRGYQPVEWEEREWRTRTVWEGRDSLPRSEVHDDEWNSRYDNSMGDWKTNDARKWDNQNVHVRSHYRNERSKDLEHGEPTQHSKRRSYNAPESREEPAIHPSAKQAAIYGSMKEEPINKKLMELAEGRLCTTTREKSSDNFQKKNSQKDKPEVKESVPVEPKRPVADESLQTLHTESDLSDISDDPDDILNMEEDTTDIETNKTRTNKKAPDTTNRDAQSTTQESAQLSPKEPAEETIFSSKSKDNADTVSLKNMEDDNMETMDFEEISDGELEEDIKTSGKGLGDALGVDWESLVKETQAKRNDSSNQDSTESRWQCRAIFYRIGISKKYAGDDFVKKLLKKYEKNDQKEFLLSDIALMHTALARNRLLQDLGNNAMHTIDDSLYRNHNASYDEDVDYDWETLKPSTALYEEAKCLLQQVTRKDNEICT